VVGEVEEILQAVAEREDLELAQAYLLRQELLTLLL
jgi:hypothetical protein